MEKRLSVAYEAYIKDAYRWIQTALNDIESLKDRFEAMRSLCKAYEYAGKAYLCKTILSKEFNIKKQSDFNLDDDLLKAMDTIIGALNKEEN